MSALIAMLTMLSASQVRMSLFVFQLSIFSRQPTLSWLEKSLRYNRSLYAETCRTIPTEHGDD